MKIHCCDNIQHSEHWPVISHKSPIKIKSARTFDHAT